MKTKPAPQKPKEPGGALVLFAQNLESMRLWYRSGAGTGPETGILVVQELVLGNVAYALELALKGERWERPAAPPS